MGPIIGNYPISKDGIVIPKGLNLPIQTDAMKMKPSLTNIICELMLQLVHIS